MLSVQLWCSVVFLMVVSHIQGRQIFLYKYNKDGQEIQLYS